MNNELKNDIEQARILFENYLSYKEAKITLKVLKEYSSMSKIATRLGITRGGAWQKLIRGKQFRDLKEKLDELTRKEELLRRLDTLFDLELA